MVRLFALILAGFAGAASGQDWQVMSGAEISSTLTDQLVIYEDAKQEFFASGRTLYNAGEDSWGRWAVRGDQYCSTWPPSNSWDCYDMARSRQREQFIDGFGNVSEGVVAE